MFLKQFIKYKLFSRSVSAKNDIDIVNKWKLKLKNENVPEIDVAIRYILGHILQTKKFDHDSLTLNKIQISKFEEMCLARLARMPLQYILGSSQFRDLTLKIVPPVFIPRPETEELVELILQQADINRNIKFLEIGCGSGAISLALLKALPHAKCTAVDQSKLACDLAMNNAKTFNLNDRINIVEENVNIEKQLNDIKETFDFIVSNPPYVKTNDIPQLEPEIKLYEDLRALDGGSDGMKVIKSILHLSANKLKTKGVLWLEVDEKQPEMISTYIKENQEKIQLKYVASYKDLFKKERFVEIVKI